jgi:GDP-L-fucose synthase
MAEAVVFALENELPEFLYNIGSGKDITIGQLAVIIQNIVGHNGYIIWDQTKPDGTPKKLLDVTKIKKLGWEYSTGLNEGIKKTYQWFQENIDNLKQIKLESNT